MTPASEPSSEPDAARARARAEKRRRRQISRASAAKAWGEMLQKIRSDIGAARAARSCR